MKLPDDTTPAIITREEHAAIKAQLKRNRELSPRNQKYQYLLRGYIYCQECGRRYHGIPQNGRTYYWCRGKTALAYDKRCHNRSVKADLIEQRVWDAVSDVISNPDRLVAAYKAEDSGRLVETLNFQLDKLKGEMELLDNAETKLIRLYAFTPMSEAKIKAEHDDIQIKRKDTEKQIKKLEERIGNIKHKEYDEARVRDLSNTLKEILKLSNDGFIEQRRQIFESLNLKVWVSRDFHSLELDVPVMAKPDCNNIVLQPCTRKGGSRG